MAALAAANREYRERWTRLIEAPDYLDLDQPMPQAALALRLISNERPVVVVALRRRKGSAKRQLTALSLPRPVQVLEGRPQDPLWRTKVRLIENSPYFDRQAIIVCASESGLRAGKELGLATIALEGPLIDSAALQRQAPDLFISGASELPGAIRKLTAGRRL